MKKTSYIIIALVIVPFVLALTSPLWLKLFIDENSNRESHWIEASTYMVSEDIDTFSSINIERLGHIYLHDETNVIIRKSNASRIHLADNIAEYISYDFEGETLTINITLLDDSDYKHIYGKTMMIIETPAIDSITAEALENITLEGFDNATASIDSDADTHFINCRIDSLTLKNSTNLILDNSKIGYASVMTSVNFGVVTDSSRIDAIKIDCDDRMRCDITETNIGTIQLEPNSNNIDLSINRPITIEYVNND